jgi:hypothetical protein
MRTNAKIWLLIAAIPLLALAAFAAWPREPQALCGGRRYALDAVANGVSPYVRLSADGVSGEFLIDYGATRSSLSAGVFKGPEGSVRNAALSLPGVAAAPFILFAYDMPLTPSGGQLGVIGTDLLSRLSVQFAGASVFVGAEPCRPEALRARGYAAISQRGFFAADPQLNDDHHPNVPVVFIGLGGVRAPAQVDTGYDDIVYTHSVDVNQPLFNQLLESGVVMDHIADINIATCAGAETRGVYRVQDRALAIETEQGATIVNIETFHLILKHANACGCIGALNAPAAQLGASFLKAFGAIVFDPQSATLWIEKQN